MRSLAFIPYKKHLAAVYPLLAQQLNDTNVTVLCRTGKEMVKDTRRVCYTSLSVQFAVPGLRWLTHGLDVPYGFVGLPRWLTDNAVTHVFACDIYHRYTRQAAAYQAIHPAVELYIISETKRWPKNPLSRFALWWSFRYWRRHQARLTAVLVYTATGEEFIRKQLPMVPVRRLFVPVAVPSPTDRDWLPGGTLRILMNARYVPFKRHGDLLAAVSLLRAQGVSVMVSFIGYAEDGRAAVEQMVRDQGLSDTVKFLDPLPPTAMTDLYRQHDVLVLPSYNEALGMVIPEAMAAGIPTITSDTVGANVYVAHEQTGFIFKTGDVAGLAAALQQLMKPVMAATLGKAACLRITQHFTPARFVENMERLLSGEQIVSTEQEQNYTSQNKVSNKKCQHQP